MKRILMIAGVLALIFGAVWWSIGSDWRRLLTSPPTDSDVLFWSQSQREAGFRMMDRLPFMVQTRAIPAGDVVAPLTVGQPLELGMDVNTYMAEQNHASLVILQDGNLRLEAYGLDFTEDGRWTSFSVAKSLTSTLVGAAIKDGYIQSLDADVTDYIEGLKGSSYDGVTVAQLLSMSSGVAWNEDYSDPQSDVALFSTHESDDGLPPVVSYMSKLGRAHPAGKVWNYSTGETNLIGILVSEATGKPLADYLAETIWGPYGMEQDATWLLTPDGREISGCCIQAATRDFARFGQFILEGAIIDGQSVVPNGWLDTATLSQIETPFRGEGYGYQWWTYDDGTFAARGIFGQGIFIDRERNLVVAMNSNWTTALGAEGGERGDREAFYRKVQAVIDAETAGAS
ncbi:MAG: serine hydrolase [Pseudomonadota bacterium]